MDSLTEGRPKRPRDVRVPTDSSLPVLEQDPGLKPNEVRWLKSLLQSYPGSRWGNTETRGLDSHFADKTYVQTDLEAGLLDSIMDRRVRLVVLFGNAGDGKTALLQHLARKMGLGKQESAKRIISGKTAHGLTVRMNLDGSAAWDGRSADDLLDEFLGPFLDGIPDEDVVHLLAINDGRLLEWIDRVDTPSIGSPWLIQRFLEALRHGSDTAAEPRIRFVNLNQRSLVGTVSHDRTRIDGTFLDGLVDALYGGLDAQATWQPCRTCSSQSHCDVWRTTQTFGPGNLANNDRRGLARRRLFEALQAVHLLGETHITMRELRATLVYALFGLRYCTDYHERDSDPERTSHPPYPDRVFDPRSVGRQGDTLDVLARFDPALDAHPKIDRVLLRESVATGSSLASARRRAYFTWPDERIDEITEDTDALGLTGGHHLRTFRDLALAGPQDDQRPLPSTEQVCADICRGISRLGTLPTLALSRKGVVPVKIVPRTPTETAFWVEKPLQSFRLEPDLHQRVVSADRRGNDWFDLHKQVSLVYTYGNGRDNTLRLRIGAALFDRLLDLRHGYQLSDVAADDMFAQLSIFVQRLVQEDHRKMYAWNERAETTVYEISARSDYTDPESRQQLVISALDHSV